MIEVDRNELAVQLRHMFIEKRLNLVRLNQERLRVLGGEVHEWENFWLVLDLSVASQP
jgi:hypothetical protein